MTRMGRGEPADEAAYTRISQPFRKAPAQHPFPAAKPSAFASDDDDRTRALRGGAADESGNGCAGLILGQTVQIEATPNLHPPASNSLLVAPIGGRSRGSSALRASRLGTGRR